MSDETFIPLISLDDLKAQLPIREGNDEFDDRLTLIANTVSRQIQTFCRRAFAAQDYAEIHHVRVGAARHLELYGDPLEAYSVRPDGVPFRLREAPLAPDAEVRVYYDRSRRFGPETVIDPARVVVLREQGALRDETLVYVSQALARSENSVRITYRAGYEADGEPATLSDSIPEDLKLAAVTQGVHLWQRLLPENVGQTQESSEKGKSNARYSVQGGLVPDVAVLVGPYRRLLRGRG